MRESELVSKLIHHIRDLPAPSHARKVHGSRYQDAGEPDVDAAVSGRAVKVEAKVPGARPTAVQYGAMRRWERAGALVGWVTCVRELEDLLSHLDDPAWENPQLTRERSVT